ncbi:MAG: MBL fold metallo-hydrolase [Chloroflexota bacterium]|nr:MBL fold metallo-hydrolase [Chloroflexota bacterium]
MYWERVTEEIYLFTSERYARVNSVAIRTKEGIVVIDALPFPSEAKQIANFLSAQGNGHFHSLMLTHHHADHSYGLFAFPAYLELIAHASCRQKLLTEGAASLAETKRNHPSFNQVTIRIPTITFEEESMFVRAGDRTFQLFSLPGHTEDNIGIYLKEERVLIAGDAVMAIPVIAQGNLQREIQTLQKIKNLAPLTILQGHGEVILRGEVDTVIDHYIDYLTCVEKKARQLVVDNKPRDLIWDIPLEACGLERVPLGLGSQQLHTANVFSVYDQLKAVRDREANPEDDAAI